MESAMAHQARRALRCTMYAQGSRTSHSDCIAAMIDMNEK